MDKKTSHPLFVILTHQLIRKKERFILK